MGGIREEVKGNGEQVGKWTISCRQGSDVYVPGIETTAKNRRTSISSNEGQGARKKTLEEKLVYVVKGVLRAAIGHEENKTLPGLWT